MTMPQPHIGWLVRKGRSEGCLVPTGAGLVDGSSEKTDSQ